VGATERCGFPQDGPGAALISEALARRFWPNEDPLGKHITLTFSPDVVREVVGIVGNVKVDSLDGNAPGGHDLHIGGAGHGFSRREMAVLLA